MATITSELFAESIVDRLNGLASEFVSEGNERDREFVQSTMFVRTIMDRYAAVNRPLSGYFAVCEVMEIQWTVLGQVLCPPLHPASSASTSSSSGVHRSSHTADAEASNIVWLALMARPFKKDVLNLFDTESLDATRRCLDAASQCFVDLLEQIQEFGEVDPDLYAFETLSESLVGSLKSTYSSFLTSLHFRNSLLSVLSSLTRST